MADTEETTQSELSKEVPDQVTEEPGNTVSPETAGSDVPVQTNPSPGAPGPAGTDVPLQTMPDVPVQTNPSPGAPGPAGPDVPVQTMPDVPVQTMPDVPVQTNPSPGAPGPAGSDVPVQTMSSPGAPGSVSTGSSLPGGGTACEDASQTRVIPAAWSTDSEEPTTCEETQRRDVSEPERETGRSDVSLSNEETAGSLSSLAGSEAVSTVTTQSAGEAVTTQSAGEAVTTQSAGEAVTTQSAGEAVTTQSAGEAGSTQSAGEAVTTQSAGEAVTTQSAGEAVTTQSAGEAVTTQSAGEAVSKVTTQSAEEAVRKVTTQSAEEAVTTQSAGEAVTTQSAEEAVSPVTTQSAEEAVTSQSAGEAVTSQSAGEAVTTQSAGEAVTTQSAGEAVTTQSAGEAVSSVTTQSAEEAVTTQSAGEAVTTQSAGEAVTTQSAGEAGSPVASEVDTIKVEVDSADQMDEEMDEADEEEVKKTPVITSSHEESSFCSLDMGVDMVENMDTGTDEQIVQEVEMQEEEDKRTIVRQESSIVNAVSIRESSQSLAVVTEKSRGPSPRMEGNKQHLEPSPSSSSSGEATTHPASTGPAAKDNPRVMKSGVRRRKRGEQERVEVKDEPVDEEYDKALAPANAVPEPVKDEPETEEDNLKISAVFSVGGASSPSVTTASPVLTSAQAQAPPLVPASMCVACSGCKKILTKGQTAYQKKGSSHLFCSTKCLTSYSPAPTPLIKPLGKRTCHYCLKDVQIPKYLIKAPVDASGTMRDFCGQTCLTAFNFKRQSAASTLSSSSASSLSSSSVSSSSTPTPNTSKARLANKCSVCKKSCLCYSHEVVNQGIMHKLCSDVCFKSFCSVNQLSLNTCTNCGGICQGKTLQMTVSNVTKSFCTAACLATYKQKNKSPIPCTMCRACRPMTEMVEVTDSEGIVELYCSTACVTAFKVQTVSASGASVECENCKQRKVPAYHLAMSDSSIRNFCTLNCVLTFQEQFNKDNTQTPMGVAQTATVPPPAPPSQSQTSQTAPSTVGGAKLPCFQCYRLCTTKPELLQIKDQLVFLCGSVCSEKFKKLNPVTERCEYCKIEKITTEVHRINGKDCAFCSEGCKLLYKHDLNKLWGRHCRSCSYCSSTSQKLVTGQFAGKNENFCSETCRSKYTMLFCQVAKCEACGRQGKLTETLPMLGEVKHFCDLQCLMRFCSQKNQRQRQSRGQNKVPISIAPTVGTTVANSDNPVIANVVSLASTPAGQPNVCANTALQGAVPSAPTKTVGNASTQTASAPPAPPRVLKNKALLCKPIVQNKGIICKPQMVNSECQTDETLPKMLVIPVPVPVYVPVPMNLYAQYTPKPLGLPIPVPVPMFLPVTLDNAERIVETILEIKERIPSNPFEADILLMAEMVAEEEEGQKEERRPSSAQVQDDQLSNFSEDLNTDDLTSLLDDWQEESTSSGLRPNRPNRLYSSEKIPPILDVPVVEQESPPTPAIMDIESEFPIETLEQMAYRRQRARWSPSPPPAPSPPLRKSRRKVQQKKKKGRRSRASVAEKEPAASQRGGQAWSLEPPRLQNKYGVDAWRRWVQWRSSQPDAEPLPRFGMRPMVLKEDVLQCTTAELGFGLCRFICEVKRPSGEPYSPDSLFYLCLGIQQYLFENGRMENIFTDVFYGKFTMEISNLLKDFQPTITAKGYVHSRVEEDYLWDCKQLGAYSPIVLLNTLLFFCTKLFGFRTLAQHRQLSFGHVMRCTTSNAGGTKTNFLRFYPPIPVKEPAADTEGVAAKKRKEEPEKENLLEMVENSENPLRCPVRLYEFYLSKCSESVKQRTNLFYLHPERSCVPNSPLWYSSMPLDNAIMEAMLTRILTIREIHLTPEGEGGGRRRKGEKAGDEAYSPPAYDDDDEDYWD